MSNYINALKWLLGSVGISGILITTGFISEISFQEKLGYSFVKIVSISEYLTTSGQFFKDCTFFIIKYLYEYPIFNIIAIISASVILLAWYIFFKKCGVIIPRVCLSSLLIILILTSILIFDLPSTEIKNMLVRGPIGKGQFIIKGNPLSKITDRLVLQQICSKDIDEDLRKEYKCEFTEGLWINNNLYFIINISITALLLSLIIPLMKDFSKLKKYKIIRGYSKFIDIIRILIALLIPLIILKVLFLPYTYSKIIRPSDFNKSIITYKNKENNISFKKGKILRNDEKEIELQIENNSKKIIIPKNRINLIETDNGKSYSELTISHQEEKLVSIHGFILSKNEYEIVLFNKNDLRIWIIPTSKVFLTKIEGEKEDVLKILIEEYTSFAGESPQ